MTWGIMGGRAEGSEPKRARTTFEGHIEMLDAATPEYVVWARWRNDPRTIATSFMEPEDVGVMAAKFQMQVMEQGLSVPFVNRPFESEIHGTVNFTQFCCVLLVTWCYRVLLSCYLRPK